MTAPASLARRRVLRTLSLTPQSAPQQATPLHPSAMPDVYGMICDGDCMQPLYMHGQLLHFSKVEPWCSGDPVAVFRRPEMLAPGESPVLFKQLVMAPPASYWHGAAVHNAGNVTPMVILRMLNPPQSLFLPADSVLGIHKCITAPIGQQTDRSMGG